MWVMNYMICQKHMYGKCCLSLSAACISILTLILLLPIITLDNGIRFWDEAVENEITMKDNNDTSWISRWEVNTTICGNKSLVTNSTRQQHFPYLFATYCTATGGWDMGIRLIRKGRKAKKIKGIEGTTRRLWILSCCLTKLRDGDN